jgi:hypothetical protein
MTDKKADANAKVQGEGDYEAVWRFQNEEQAFVRDSAVVQRAREAADALDGPERPELEAARNVSAAGRSVKP